MMSELASPVECSSKSPCVRCTADQAFLRGRNGAYAMSPDRMPLKGTMIIDSPIARTGQCGEALFTGPSSVPRCTFNRTGTTLHCK